MDVVSKFTFTNKFCASQLTFFLKFLLETLFQVESEWDADNETLILFDLLLKVLRENDYLFFD